MHVLREKAMAGIILLKLAARRHQMHTLVGYLTESELYKVYWLCVPKDKAFSVALHLGAASIDATVHR